MCRVNDRSNVHQWPLLRSCSYFYGRKSLVINTGRLVDVCNCRPSHQRNTAFASCSSPLLFFLGWLKKHQWQACVEKGWYLPTSHYIQQAWSRNFKTHSTKHPSNTCPWEYGCTTVDSNPSKLFLDLPLVGMSVVTRFEKILYPLQRKNNNLTPIAHHRSLTNVTSSVIQPAKTIYLFFLVILLHLEAHKENLNLG